MMILCPHCHAEYNFTPQERVNIARFPVLREQIQNLSLFRATCPNCGETMLVLHPCLYHDMVNRFMVWLWVDQKEPIPQADFDPLAGYTLRVVDSMNAFREKILLLEQGLDDRAIEIMKLLLYAQLTHDLDVVELLFHELDPATGTFRFVAVLSDGVEQYIAMPGTTYQRLHADVDTYLYTPAKDFAHIDMVWAQEALELLHEIH